MNIMIYYITMRHVFLSLCCLKEYFVDVYAFTLLFSFLYQDSVEHETCSVGRRPYRICQMLDFTTSQAVQRTCVQSPPNKAHIVEFNDKFLVKPLGEVYHPSDM